MTRYTINELAVALRSIGVAKGQTLLVHSALMSFGRMEGCRSSEIAPRIYDLLRDIIGLAGTIVVPAFNFDFCKGIAFDPATTPSKAMGVFSEFVRTHPDAVRSPHPTQSVAAVGRLARLICKADTASSFDPSGPFSLMLEHGAHGLLLGAPMQSFSLVHLAEERCLVSYRYWKTFTGPYGVPAVPKAYRMFVRNLDQNPKLVLQRIDDVLSDHGLIHSAKVGASMVKLFRLSDFLALSLERLTLDPQWLIETKA